MCGIAGITSDEPNIVKKMLKTLEYRGPDSKGLMVDEAVSLGHRRLSIIDLKTGDQPIHNEDETLWVILNGEIYNYKNLYSSLQKSHSFYTKSDTEVIVHLFEDYDVEAFRYLEGDFAFCLYDSIRKKIYLVRDRLGIKPLYYTFQKELLLFASEIKPLFQNDFIPLKISVPTLREFLSYRYVIGENTLFEGIKRLLPGCFLYYDLKKKYYNIQKYWNLNDFLKNPFNDEKIIVSELRTKLSESVSRQLMSDVSLGAFLSGGLDSSIIVALASNQMDEILKTFTVRFDNYITEDIKYSKIVSEHFSTEHKIIDVNTEDCRHYLPYAIWHLEEPVVDAAIVPMYIISKHVSPYIRVILAGEGGDELFGGYERYQVMKLCKLISKFSPGFLRKLNGFLGQLINDHDNLRRFFLSISSSNEIDIYRNITCLFDKLEINYIAKDLIRCRANLKRVFPSTNDFLHNAFCFDILTLLPSDFFLKIDKMTAAHGLEERVPLLDTKIVETALRIPSRFKIKGRTEKYILRKAVSDILPEEIIKRKKQGFNAPMRIWILHSLDDFISTALNEKKAKKFIDYNFFKKFYESYRKEKVSSSYTLDFLRSNKMWAFVTFEIWYRTFFESDPRNPLTNI